MIRSTIMAIILFFSNNSLAYLEYCFEDSLSHGHHSSPLSPRENCAELIFNHPQSLFAESPLKTWRAYGFKNMIYVENLQRDTNNQILRINRYLLAGDQTRLHNIEKIKIYEDRKKLLILQSERNKEKSILQFNLDFIGNVSPYNYVKFDFLKSIEDFDLHDDNIILYSSDNHKVFALNINADIRFKGNKFKPKLFLLKKYRNNFGSNVRNKK